MTPNQLLQLQSLPFTDKLEYSKQLVKEWYVLFHLTRTLGP